MVNNSAENTKKNSASHAVLPRNPYNDERVTWLRAKVESSLYADFEQSKLPPTVLSRPMDVQAEIPVISDCFLDCLSRDENRNLQLLMDYLQDTGDSASGNLSALMFWFEKVTNKLEVKVNIAVEENAVADLGAASQQQQRQTSPGFQEDSLDNLAGGDTEVLKSNTALADDNLPKPLTASSALDAVSSSRPAGLASDEAELLASETPVTTDPEQQQTLSKAASPGLIPHFSL